MKNRLSLIVFIAVLGLLGYVRENFFVNINIQLYSKYYNSPPLRPQPSFYAVFDGFSYTQLYYAKYIFTVAFVAVFFFAQRLALKKTGASPLALKILNYAYLIIVVLAAASMAYGYLVNNRLQDDEYTMSRWLMGVAQSPIIFIILVASETLINTYTHHDKKG